MSDKLSKAKSLLVLDQPFFASLLLPMPVVDDPRAKTIATDGEKIYQNPEFMANKSLPETVFLVGHETLHCAMQHMFRRGAMDHGRFNRAADYIVNDILVKEKIGIMPEGGLLDAALVEEGGGTVEGVYRVLSERERKNDSGKEGDKGDSGNESSPGNQGPGEPDPNGKPGQDKQPGPGEPGGSLDEIFDAQGDAAELSQKEADMRVRIVQAAQAAKACGKLSGGLARLVSELTETRTEWRAILRRFLSEKAKTDLSYARPKRRFLADDLYLPSLVGEKMGGLVVAVDCSGSVDDALLAQFAVEIKAIAEDTKPSIVHVVYFDSKVKKQDSFEDGDAIEIRAYGRGGTAFSPIFQHVESEQLNPVACVVLTDLCCDDFGPAPEYPVLWASIEKRDSVPFGEIVLIKE